MREHLKLYIGQRVLRCCKCERRGGAEHVHPSKYCYIVVRGSRTRDTIPCAYLSNVMHNGVIEEAEWEEVDL